MVDLRQASVTQTVGMSWESSLLTHTMTTLQELPRLQGKFSDRG